MTVYANAIEAAGRLGRSEEPLRHLFASRGRALELSGRYDEAVANDEAWRSLAEERGDRSAVLAADLALATLHSTPTPRFDAERGRALSERTLALARELGDRLAESKALWNLMILDVFGGKKDLRDAVDAGERSLAIAREIDAREQMAFTLTDLWRPYAAVGDLAASRSSLEEATPMWRELGNLPMLSENLASLSSLRRLAGDDAEALALAEEGCRISEEIGNPWGQAYGLINSYGIFWDRGDVGRTMSSMRECIALAERASFGLPQATTRAELATVHANLGDLEGARELIDVALGIADERQPLARPYVMAAEAEFQLLRGDLVAAEAAAEQTYLELLPESIQMAVVRARIVEAGDQQIRAAELASDIVDRLRRQSATALPGRGVPPARDLASQEGRVGAGRGDLARGALGGRRPRSPSRPVGDPS